MPTRNLFACVDARVWGRALASFLLLTACGDDANPTPGDESTGTDGDTTGDPSTSPSTTISTSTTPTTTMNPSTTGATDDSSTTSDETTTGGVETETEGPGTTSLEECGNDLLEGDEECDGTDLGGADCESEGFDGGELACDAACALDASGCFSMTCGNDTIEGKEVCDGDDLDGATCVTEGFDDGELACDDGCAVFDTSNCIDYECGDNVADPGETCDGTDLEDEDCASQGMGGGTLACLDDCTGFDFEGCGAENCIEEDIGSAVGASVTSGTTVGEDEDLAQVCAAGGSVDRVVAWTAPAAGLYVIDTNGSGYDTALAVYTDCESAEIVCDDDDGTGSTSRLWVSVDDGQVILISVNGYDGATGNWVLNINAFDATGPCCGADQTVGCNDPACTSTICNDDNYCCDTAWDTVCSGDAVEECGICSTPDICGNGVTEMGETCDAPDLGGATCQTQGFDGGNLACAEDCSAIDPSDCVTFDGDCCTAHGAAEPGCEDDACFAEVCAANPACCTDTWTEACAEAAIATCEVCFVPDVCGNYLIDGVGELCDRTDLGGETCQTQGFDGGTLGCAMDCATFDTTDCVIFAGDCCADNGADSPGCDDEVCTAAVCAADPYCCETTWDPSCANQGLGLCGVCGGGVGDCCTETGDVGCDDAECVEIICGFGGLDSSCCTTDWTSACTDLATANCPVCV